ncbi:hypothetical protein GCM10027290_57430 [Micromonospora sonneratiae]|uniref:Uncharacterized protein n=1 Tax=Micromonospora sonneratiae TaxID=1184706 RepID=A0ABW3YN89_9ACTN
MTVIEPEPSLAATATPTPVATTPRIAKPTTVERTGRRVSRDPAEGNRGARLAPFRAAENFKI